MTECLWSCLECNAFVKVSSNHEECSCSAYAFPWGSISLHEAFLDRPDAGTTCRWKDGDKITILRPWNAPQNHPARLILIYKCQRKVGCVAQKMQILHLCCKQTQYNYIQNKNIRQTSHVTSNQAITSHFILWADDIIYRRQIWIIDNVWCFYFCMPPFSLAY